MQISPELLWMSSVGGLQICGMRSRRLVYKEVFETQSNYEKPNFQWFGNLASGDSTGSKWIKKDQDQVMYLLDYLFEGRGEKEKRSVI